MQPRAESNHDTDLVSSEMVKETLEFSDTQLSEVEDVLGLNIDGVFHEIREVKDSEAEPGEVFEKIDWAWGKPKRVLEFTSNPSKGDLAYLAVMGHMKRLDFQGGGDMFPVMDQFALSRYSEFVANLARNEFEELEVTTNERYDLLDAKREYFQKRGEADIHGFPKNDVLDIVNQPEFDKTKLAVEYDIAGETVKDEDFRREFRGSIKELQDQRAKVASKLAAKRYAETEEYDVSEFIMPDMQLYQETMDLFKVVENKVESKRHDLRTGDAEDSDDQNI